MRKFMYSTLSAMALAASCLGSQMLHAQPSNPGVSSKSHDGAPAMQAAPMPTITPPDQAGAGVAVFAGSIPRVEDFGYVSREYFVKGTARAYTVNGALNPDGKWSAAIDTRPQGSAPYVTRMVVNMPADRSKFNGTVYVEWLNVSGQFDYAVMREYGGIEMMREGAAWVGISVQRAGITGSSGLKVSDPVRYGSLSHPGDLFAFDIFSQAAMATWFNPQVLGGVTPKRLIATGHSQSAMWLGGYINGVAPLSHVFNGYLVSGRGSLGFGINGRILPSFGVRDDLKDPVLMLFSETEIVGNPFAGLPSYVPLRRPDTDSYVAWEVPGTVHTEDWGPVLGAAANASTTEADYAYFDQLKNPKKELYGGFFVCQVGINAGPQTYIVRAALRQAADWVRSGNPPKSHDHVQVTPTASPQVFLPVTDAFGNALGGVRTPHLDAPVAKLSALGNPDPCGASRGSTIPFTDAQLKSLYPVRPQFKTKWNAAVLKAMATGAITSEDGRVLRQVAGDSSYAK